MFAIVDIETCGGKFQYKYGRIIDICILKHDGLSVVEKYSTLVNPECTIAQMYTNITGITNEMVKDAPKFHEIAAEILRITEGCVFVAHNVSFDYGFVKDEFASLGYKYKRDTLCTVRLSRKLMPGKVSYSLGNLCESLGIQNTARHRAEGDAVATTELFDRLIQLKTQHPQYKKMGVDKIMTRRIDKIKKYILDKLPESCGVYYFLNQEGEIIYIGKSTNMYNRAISHFNNDDKKARKMLYDLYQVDYVETGSELIALLLEAEEIKKHKPAYNRLSKEDHFLYGISFFTDSEGIMNLRLVEGDDTEQPIARFNKLGAAREKLDQWVDEHELCLRYVGLMSEESTCFHHQIKKCKGICCQQESVTAYNKRVQTLLNNQYLFQKTGFILDQGLNSTGHSLILIENGRYYGYGYIDETSQLSSLEEIKHHVTRRIYYPDSDYLIQRWLKKKGRHALKLIPSETHFMD